MANPTVLEVVLDGQVTEVGGGSGPGDHAFVFTAEFPRSGAPALVRIPIHTQTIEPVREAGKRLYTRARLVVRLEVPEICICGRVHGGEQPPHAAEGAALSLDGTSFVALVGENLQEGVAGFGLTPAEACAEFDRAWREVPRG